MKPILHNLAKVKTEDGAWQVLNQHLTDKRRARMLETAGHRTNHVRLVIQDVHDPHNISACLRSAEAFGVLNVDIVQTRGRFRTSSVARGSSGWLRMRQMDQIPPCVEDLKKAGYRLAAGLPTRDSLSLWDLPTAEPIAVVFGNEHAGISEEWIPYLDYKFTIPMVGMVESLNISVSAAITLNQLVHSAKESLGSSQFFLNESERENLLDEWIMRQLPSAARILARHRREST